MTDIDQQIQEGVQRALQEKEEKDRLAWRFVTAALFAGIAGYAAWSNFALSFLFFGMKDLFWLMGIAAVIGFFIQELLVIALILIGAGFVYHVLLK